MDILKIEKKTDFKHLNLFSVKYKDKKNNEKFWIFASRSKKQVTLKNKVPCSDAVVVIPWHREENKLVIIKEFRVPICGYQYGFPAGLIDKGETAEQAGKRELKEETGLDFVKVIKKSPSLYSSSGITDETVSLIYVECKGNPTTKLNEDSEDIEVIFLSCDDAVKLLKTRDIKFDVKTWIVLSNFIHYGKI
ncbi:MAG: DNA mismatch repair protein MutT [Desulfobacteraceae bacterium 4572_130]|nr:MAG: DNA mismatch repair protein MutT [Desulfobacteraceae bacterium 4572_130]